MLIHTLACQSGKFSLVIMEKLKLGISLGVILTFWKCATYLKVTTLNFSLSVMVYW